jgi:hypothetical protein
MSTQNIKAKDHAHLKSLVEREIEVNGNNCSLNHIDVSGIGDMANLFRGSAFNGDISQWNTSGVMDMHGMFLDSHFNGDISKWDTFNVRDTSYMFSSSIFNGDISQWNVSQLTYPNMMFFDSQFKGDLRRWKLNEGQMQVIFKSSLLDYLAARRSIEEKEQLCANFTQHSQKSSNKKTL